MARERTNTQMMSSEGRRKKEVKTREVGIMTGGNPLVRRYRQQVAWNSLNGKRVRLTPGVSFITPALPRKFDSRDSLPHIMASNIFEDLQSPVSYDADFDKGWHTISEKRDDPVTFLFQLLQKVYWDAVRDEIANAILAFDDYKTFVPEGLPELGEGALESEYLRELLNLWDPLGLSEDIKNKICGSVFDNVKDRQNVSQDELIVRALLQACGEP
ncbi:hypothetical protein BJX99DRAFT_77918 [Aspergillus californicus]